MQEIILLVVSAALVNNVILARFLGLCSFMGVTTRVDTAIGMGFATTFVITLSSIGNWAIEEWLLEPYGLGYLRTVSFILTIASAVQLNEALFRKFSPALFKLLGIYLPLITTNCAVLGIPLLNAQAGHGLGMSVLGGFGSGAGFTLVMILFAGLRERLALMRVPQTFAGPPVAFITASLLALAFMGFTGLVPAGGG